jgi:hypothetical protein
MKKKLTFDHETGRVEPVDLKEKKKNELEAIKKKEKRKKKRRTCL